MHTINTSRRFEWQLICEQALKQLAPISFFCPEKEINGGIVPLCRQQRTNSHLWLIHDVGGSACSAVYS